MSHLAQYNRGHIQQIGRPYLLYDAYVTAHEGRILNLAEMEDARGSSHNVCSIISASRSKSSFRDLLQIHSRYPVLSKRLMAWMHEEEQGLPAELEL